MMSQMVFVLTRNYILDSFQSRTRSISYCRQYGVNDDKIESEWLALPTSDHGVADSGPARGEIIYEPDQCSFKQSLSK